MLDFEIGSSLQKEISRVHIKSNDLWELFKHTLRSLPQ